MRSKLIRSPRAFVAAFCFTSALTLALAGGGALLRGIDVVISNATGLDVRICDDPLTCVARGTSIYLENLEEWKATMESNLDDI